MDVRPVRRGRRDRERDRHLLARIEVDRVEARREPVLGAPQVSGCRVHRRIEGRRNTPRSRRLPWPGGPGGSVRPDLARVQEPETRLYLVARPVVESRGVAEAVGLHIGIARERPYVVPNRYRSVELYRVVRRSGQPPAMRKPRRPTARWQLSARSGVARPTQHHAARKAPFPCSGRASDPGSDGRLLLSKIDRQTKNPPQPGAWGMREPVPAHLRRRVKPLRERRVAVRPLHAVVVGGHRSPCFASRGRSHG